MNEYHDVWCTRRLSSPGSHPGSDGGRPRVDRCAALELVQARLINCSLSFLRSPLLSPLIYSSLLYFLRSSLFLRLVSLSRWRCHRPSLTNRLHHQTISGVPAAVDSSFADPMMAAAAAGETAAPQGKAGFLVLKPCLSAAAVGPKLLGPEALRRRALFERFAEGCLADDRRGAGTLAAADVRTLCGSLVGHLSALSVVLAGGTVALEPEAERGTDGADGELVGGAELQRAREALLRGLPALERRAGWLGGLEPWAAEAGEPGLQLHSLLRTPLQL